MSNTSPVKSVRTLPRPKIDFVGNAAKALEAVRLLERQVIAAGLPVAKPFDPTKGFPKGDRHRPALFGQKELCDAEAIRLEKILTEKRERVRDAAKCDAMLAARAAAMLAVTKPVAPVSNVTIRDGFRFEKMADGSTRVDKA